VVAVLVLALAALVVGVARASAPTAPAGGAPAARPGVTVVRSGETLWDIAVRTAPAADPRATVAAIEARNGLNGSAVRPGPRLELPAAAG
jgi:Tfp pilus assembly protein FimV